MNKEIKEFYDELDDTLYHMSVCLELFRIIENEIWENSPDALRTETAGVLSLAINNYEKIFNRLNEFFETKFKI